jgi:hypothetical protein
MDNKVDDLSKSINLKFGKCIVNQQSSSMEELVTKLKLNIPFHHHPECPLHSLYLDKSESEIIEIEGKVEDLIKTKNKKMKYASVGIISDKNVCIV